MGSGNVYNKASHLYVVKETKGQYNALRKKKLRKKLKNNGSLE